MAKIFVLDTNIILHDFNAVKQFQDNDIVIPIAVIEELDKFKKGEDNLSFNARAFMREINKLTDKHDFGPRGVPLGKKLGYIKIEPNHPFAPEYQDLFRDDIQDHRILSTAMWVRDTHPSKFVALVTKDINLRLKAKAVGMAAQDYLRDRVDDEAMMGIEKEVIVADANTDALQRLAYGQDNALPWQDVADKEPRPNQLYKFNFGGDTVCARYDAHRKEVVLVKTKEACGIRPRNDEQKFALDACLNPNLPLVSLTGGRVPVSPFICFPLTGTLQVVPHNGRHTGRSVLQRPLLPRNEVLPEKMTERKGHNKREHQNGQRKIGRQLRSYFTLKHNFPHSAV